MSDEHDFNALRRVLAERQRAPIDTVGHRGLTVEALRELDKLCGTTQPVTDGGNITESGVDATDHYNDAIGGIIVSRRTIAKLGVDPGTVPNTHVPKED